MIKVTLKRRLRKLSTTLNWHLSWCYNTKYKRMAENTPKTSNLKLNEWENQLLFTQCNGFPRALDRPSFKLEKQKETRHGKACSKTLGKNQSDML